jgi:hypothetical protein
MGVITSRPDPDASRCMVFVDGALKGLRAVVTKQPTICTESPESFSDCLDEIASYFSARLHEATDSSDELHCRVCQSPLRSVGGDTWAECHSLIYIGWHISGQWLKCDQCAKRLEEALTHIKDICGLHGK